MSRKSPLMVAGLQKRLLLRHGRCKMIVNGHGISQHVQSCPAVPISLKLILRLAGRLPHAVWPAEARTLRVCQVVPCTKHLVYIGVRHCAPKVTCRAVYKGFWTSGITAKQPQLRGELHLHWNLAKANNNSENVLLKSPGPPSKVFHHLSDSCRSTVRQ